MSDRISWAIKTTPVAPEARVDALFERLGLDPKVRPQGQYFQDAVGLFPSLIDGSEHYGFEHIIPRLLGLYEKEWDNEKWKNDIETRAYLEEFCDSNFRIYESKPGKGIDNIHNQAILIVIGKIREDYQVNPDGFFRKILTSENYSLRKSKKKKLFGHRFQTYKIVLKKVNS